MQGSNPKRSRRYAPFFLTAALIWAVFLFGAPANAQSICNTRDFVVSQLETMFQEYPKAVGLAGGGNVVELFVSEGGSWTLILSMPDGTSCLMADGESWETIPIPVKGTAL